MASQSVSTASSLWRSSALHHECFPCPAKAFLAPWSYMPYDFQKNGHPLWGGRDAAKGKNEISHSREATFASRICKAKYHAHRTVTWNSARIRWCHCCHPLRSVFVSIRLNNANWQQFAALIFCLATYSTLPRILQVHYYYLATEEGSEGKDKATYISRAYRISKLWIANDKLPGCFSVQFTRVTARKSTYCSKSMQKETDQFIYVSFPLTCIFIICTQMWVL